MDAATKAARDSALLDVASALTGIERVCCQWENDPRVMHNGSLVLLRDVSEVSVGIDATTYDYAADADPLLEMTPIVSGNRVLVVQLDIEVHDQSRGVNAGAIASHARTRLRFPSVLAMLEAVGLAVVGAEQVVVTDYELDGHMVSRRSVDLRFNGVDSETDTAGRAPYIATVETTATITHPDGSAVAASISPGGVLP